MGIPIMEEGADGVDGYLPNEDWFNYFTYTRLTTYNQTMGATGQNYSFCSSLSDTAHVPVIQRGGTVVYTQDPGLTTTETLMNPYTLRVAVNYAGHALGSMELIHPDALGEGPTGAPPAWLSIENAFLTYNATGGVVGRVSHALLGRADYNITGKAYHSMVIVGLDIPEGVKLPLPTFTVGGRTVPLTGVTVTVHNGAVVVTDPSNALFLISDPTWTLVWASQKEEGEVMERVEEVQVASE